MELEIILSENNPDLERHIPLVFCRRRPELPFLCVCREGGKVMKLGRRPSEGTSRSGETHQTIVGNGIYVTKEENKKKQK